VRVLSIVHFGGLFGFGENEKRAPAAPPSVEPIVAYRSWRVGKEEMLISATFECVWNVRERMTATCRQPVTHPAAPAWDCRCGFYAFKTHGALAASEYALGSSAVEVVCGRVALWGTVIDHETGYRAEHAYPQVLYLRGDRSDEVVRRIADRYAIECVPLSLRKP